MVFFLALPAGVLFLWLVSSTNRLPGLGEVKGGWAGKNGAVLSPTMPGSHL